MITRKGVLKLMKEEEPVDCLNLHLREISLNDYRGTVPDVSFLKYFILNATVLKVLRIGVIFEHQE